MSTTPLKTQSTAKSTTSVSASESSVATALTIATTPLTPVSPGKIPAPPSSLPVSPISPRSSNNGGASTRSDSISFGSILAPDTPATERASLAVSMTSVNEIAKSEVELEEAHEIHCDHLSVHSQTSGTASYLTVEPMPDFVLHYSKKKKPKAIHQGKLNSYGDSLNAKRVVLHPHNAQPLRCKANPKLLKLLNTRQKALRKANLRVRRNYQITALRILPRDPMRAMGDRDMGVGYVETHITALNEFIASPISAHSRLLIRTKFDETNTNVVSVDIDVLDERAGGREEEDEVETRVPDAQVRADFYSTLDRPPAKSTESLANVLTDCEASTMMKAHDASTAKPISARPAGGLFSRMIKRLTFGVFG